MADITADSLFQELLLQPASRDADPASILRRAGASFGEAKERLLPDGATELYFSAPGRSLHFLREAGRVLGGGLVFEQSRLTLGPCTAMGPRAVAFGSGTSSCPFTLLGLLAGGIVAATIAATAVASAEAALSLYRAVSAVGPLVCPSPCQPYSIPVPGVPTVTVTWTKFFGIPVGGIVTVTEVASATIFCM